MAASDQWTSDKVKKVNKSLAFLVKSFEANTLRATTLYTINVTTPQVKKTKRLMALQAVMCYVSHKTMEKFEQVPKFFFLDSSITNKLQY